jgi:hypothetical protein
MQVTELNKRKFAPASETEKAKGAEKLKKMRIEADKLVKGMFEFLDAQGGWLDFNYRFFPDEPIRTVRIVHGEICDIPMCLVKHLNNIWVKVRTLPKNLDVDKPFIEKRSRTRFTPMDVM